MAKKRGPKKRTGVRRWPNGQIRADGGSDYSLMQRMVELDRTGLPQLLSILGHSAQENPVAGECEFVGRDAERVCDHARISGSEYCWRHHREAQDIVLANTARARNPNLSFPIGQVFERGLLVTGDSDGRELLQAADVYAGLHRQVWGRLPKDIEADIIRRYGPNAFNLLLEVGRIKAPAPPASHFRKLVGQTHLPNSSGLDPDEYLRRRLRLADRYAAARNALQDAGLDCVAIVENLVIDGVTPNFLRPGAQRTARTIADRNSLLRGLVALANSFGLFDRRAAAAG